MAGLKPKQGKTCIQGKPPSLCKDCGGSGLCENQRVRSQCKKCSGCPHKRVKSLCKDCGGSGICEHLQIKRACKPVAVGSARTSGRGARAKTAAAVASASTIWW